MSKEVYANGMEISAKNDDNKSICAMPDVCLSPPSPPAGPVPIPYPNTAQASDTTDGSKTVLIGGSEVGLKNSSCYKKSTGDEAATKSLGMGVVTHTIQGKMKHAAWSFDVKIEGENAIRHMDLTTHNHMNTQNSGSTILNQAKQKISEKKPLNCEELDAINKENRRKDVKPAQKKKFTLTTASYTQVSHGPAPARSFFVQATAPGRDKVIKSGKRNGYAPANTKTTMACTDEPYGGARGGANEVENEMTRNHAEPKLIEPFFAPGGPGPGGATLLMKTHHQTSPGNADAMPCDTCRPAICKAVACGLNIKLCNDKNEPVDPACKNGEPLPESEWAARGLG
jgi:hypothetical protein